MSHSTPAAQLRKVKKPLIERRRRERINEYLNELMKLVHEATGTKCAKSSSKMEKAEILEMTVEYLRKLHRQNSTVGHGRPTFPSSISCLVTTHQDTPRPVLTSSSSDDAVTCSHMAENRTASDYVAGFSECARQVRRFLSHHQTGNATESQTSLPGSTAASTESGDGPQMLWRHLSDYVTVRRCRSMSNSDDLSVWQTPSKAGQNTDILSSETTSASAFDQSASSVSFPSGFIVPIDSGDNVCSQTRLLPASHPIFAVFATSDAKLAASFSGQPSSMPLATVSSAHAQSLLRFGAELAAGTSTVSFMPETLPIVQQLNYAAEMEAPKRNGLVISTESDSIAVKNNNKNLEFRQEVWRPWGKVPPLTFS